MRLEAYKEFQDEGRGRQFTPGAMSENFRELLLLVGSGAVGAVAGLAIPAYDIDQ